MHRKPWLVAAVVLVVLVVLSTSVGGWLLWSGRVASGVSVTWSPGSPACEGTTVDEPLSRRPVIVAKKGMRCVIEVEVTNRSGRTVQVVDAVARFVGPRTGAALTAQNAEPAERGSPYGIDAHFPIDRSLAPGESTTLEIVLVLHPRGCNSGTLWVSEWPTVTVEALGRSHDVRGDTDFGLRSTMRTTPGCTRM